ncbi:MAG: biotin transporter BioY [Pseudomonadota bacterium]
MGTATLSHAGVGATIVDRMWPDQVGNSATHRALRFVGLALIGTALLTMSAKIKVPLFQVDITLQTFAVLALAAAYGRNLAVATVLLYLAQGAAGLPVFTDTPERGLGLAYMLGTTGGYLAGFVVAAAIVGSAADRGWSNSIWKIGGAMIVADILLFVLGVGWLASLIGAENALLFGLYPFIPGEVLKIALAALAVPAVMALLAPRQK